MNDSASQELPLSGDKAVNIVNGFICLIVTTIVVTFFPVLYKKVRSKFPVVVNCWFCNQCTKVPYNDANCWDCPHCEQYNGFNKDGGYNKEIRKQHSHTLNPLVFNDATKLSAINTAKKGSASSNGLCKICNINQQLKIQQLARFVPLNDSKYDEEVEQFKEQLEKSYQLCSRCETVLTETLQNQQYNLLKDRLNEEKEKVHFIKHNGSWGQNDWSVVSPNLRRLLCSSLKIISGTISLIIFVSFISNSQIELPFLDDPLPEVLVIDFEPYVQGILNVLKYFYEMRKEFVSIGLMCYALSSFFRQTLFDCPSLLIFWGVLYALTWSDMIELQIMVSAVCACLSALELRSEPLRYELKKISPEPGRSARAFDPSRLDEAEGNRSATRRKKNRERKANSNESEEPIQTVANPEEPAPAAAVAAAEESPKRKQPSPKAAGNEPKIRPGKVFNKSFLASLDCERIEKEMSPPPEIFQNLNNLHLGNGPGPVDKQSNFLFENHSFDGRFKKVSPIIKPPKFVKPVANPWTNGESNETISRSSTPSSGYSSQRPEKGESRQSFNFPKVMSPVPFAQAHPQDNFDFWDRSHPCFNPGNFHYFNPPGYLPFQQFTNPLGHTTVYTYTRPANYPFSFPPSPNSQGYSHSSGACTPRFSDASDSANLFQNASSSFQSDKKWSAVKSALYSVRSYFKSFLTSLLCAGTKIDLMLEDLKEEMFQRIRSLGDLGRGKVWKKRKGSSLRRS